MCEKATVLAPGENREEWLQLWRATGREPFAHPGYCELVAGTGARAFALAVRSHATTALVPLIWTEGRAQTDVSFVTVDVASPYGYGGPYFDGPQRLASVLTEVQKSLASIGVTTAFLRLDLGIDVDDDEPAPNIVVRDTSLNVIVDLTLSEEEQWQHVAHKVRKNVNKARRSGCTVVHDHDFSRLGDFLQIYRETMDRRQAADWFYFESNFFEKLRHELGDLMNLFLVLDSAGHAISAEIVLESDRRLYSFLGGTLSHAFALAPNDLLKYEVIRSGADRGKEQFVLGGGFRPGDGIFRYKSAFSPGRSYPYRTVRMVVDEGEFRRLSGLSHESQLGGTLMADFFPRYRQRASAPPSTRLGGEGCHNKHVGAD